MRRTTDVGHDLLVYGRLAPQEAGGLVDRWVEQVDRSGVEVRFHPDFNPAFHSGHPLSGRRPAF